jgi:hypothetical protein
LHLWFWGFTDVAFVPSAALIIFVMSLVLHWGGRAFSTSGLQLNAGKEMPISRIVIAVQNTLLSY